MNKKNNNIIPSSLFSRNPQKEAIYGIKSITYYAYKCGESFITVVGQIFGDKILKKRFCLIMTIYDNDGDVMVSKQSESYGSGLVSSMINAESFFDGFPFAFKAYEIIWNEMSRIEITPEEEY